MTCTWMKRLGKTGVCLSKDAIGTSTEGRENKDMLGEKWIFLESESRIWEVGESLQVGMEGEQRVGKAVEPRKLGIKSTQSSLNVWWQGGCYMFTLHLNV